MSYKKKKLIKNILLTIVVITYIIITTKFYGPVKAVGESMEPTIISDSFYICDKTANIYNYDDIVLVKIKQPINISGHSFSIPSISIIKRIVGTPGDTLQIINGVLYINGIPENRSFDIIDEPGILSDAITLKENQYFCMGDNRNHSTDSRYFGAFDISSIEGKLIKKIYSPQ